MIKFNNGKGAVICDICRVIIKEGNDEWFIPYFDDKHYCIKCLDKLPRDLQEKIKVEREKRKNEM